MQRFRMDQAGVIPGVANGPCGRPFELEDQEGLVSHAARPTKDAFDDRVDRLDDAKADGVVAVRGNAIDVRQQEVPEAFHFGQLLPAQRLEPAEQEIQHPRTGLVGPEAIELLPQDVRFEQPAIGGEQFPELPPLRLPRTVAQRRSSSQRLPRPTARITSPARKNS